MSSLVFWCYFLLLFIRFLALLSGHLKNRPKKTI
jgi:hypothetical protein